MKNYLVNGEVFTQKRQQIYIQTSGGSRISRGGGRGPVRGAMDLRCGHFSAQMNVKTKELGPVGGVRPARPLDPPMQTRIHEM